MSPRRGSRGRAWLAVAAWLAVIWTATSIPGRMLPQAPDNSDKVAHFMLYAPLGFLLLRALWPGRGGCGCLLGLLTTVVALGAGLAWLDEWHQQFVANRTCTVSDWQADVLGLGGGAMVGALLAVGRRARHRGPGDSR